MEYHDIPKFWTDRSRQTVQTHTRVPLEEQSNQSHEALIAETAVWPNFYLMNIFFALKGSKLFIIIHYFLHVCFNLLVAVPRGKTHDLDLW